MSFASGTATSPVDLLSKWRTFLVTTSGLYAENEYYSGTDYQRLTVNRGGKFFNCYAETTGGVDTFHISLSTAHVSSVDIGLQTNESLRAETNLPSAPYAGYQFYSYADSAHGVIEYSAGKYRHIGLGNMIKVGSYTGGDFAAGTYWKQTGGVIDQKQSGSHRWPFHGLTSAILTASISQTVFRADKTSPIPQWRYCGKISPQSGYARGSTLEGPYGNTNDTLGIFKDSVNNFNGRHILLPIYMFASDEASRWMPAGMIDNVRIVNMTNLSPGSELVIGSDTWAVYPISQKNGTVGQEDSGVHGLAYKKVV